MPAKPNPGEMQWVTINDFRPGIFSQTNFGAGTLNNQVPVPSLTPGAAQANGTYACVALPNGGLAPMPSAVQFFPSVPGACINGINNYLTCMITYGRVDFSDEIVYGFDVNSAGSRSMFICAIRSDGAWNRTLVGFGPSASASSATYALTGGLTLTNPNSNQSLPPFTAGAAISTSFINDAAPVGATPYLGIYPDPTNPGGTAIPHAYSGALPSYPNLNGIIFLAQGRIIFLQQNEYLWTTNTDVLAGEFEQWYWTDPILTVPGFGNATSLTQSTSFVPEHQVGIGTVGSVSAGEIFAVKRNGGGFIISGDLDSSFTTYLGGVTPTFGLDHTSASTPLGIAYLSNNNGVWAWNGSNTSQKLSTNLNDDFFNMNFPPNIGPRCNLVPWGKYLVVPNNYVYDTELGGWWKLDNQAVPFCWYGTSFDGNSLYCMPPLITNNTQPIIYRFAKSTPANLFQWKSFPISTTSDPNRTNYIRECVTKLQGTGMVTITLQSTVPFSGSGRTDPLFTRPINYPVNSPNVPISIRQTVGFDAQDVTVTINSRGSANSPAPIIYSVNIGYQESKLVNAT